MLSVFWFKEKQTKEVPLGRLKKDFKRESTCYLCQVIGLINYRTCWKLWNKVMSYLNPCICSLPGITPDVAMVVTSSAPPLHLPSAGVTMGLEAVARTCWRPMVVFSVLPHACKPSAFVTDRVMVSSAMLVMLKTKHLPKYQGDVESFSSQSGVNDHGEGNLGVCSPL